MGIHNQCFRAKKGNIIIFHLKIYIFTALKYCCILVLHGRVFVMIRKEWRLSHNNHKMINRGLLWGHVQN